MWCVLYAGFPQIAGLLITLQHACLYRSDLTYRDNASLHNGIIRFVFGVVLILTQGHAYGRDGGVDCSNVS